jgi:hypothetical protein
MGASSQGQGRVLQRHTLTTHGTVCQKPAVGFVLTELERGWKLRFEGSFPTGHFKSLDPH